MALAVDSMGHFGPLAPQKQIVWIFWKVVARQFFARPATCSQRWCNLICRLRFHVHQYIQSAQSRRQKTKKTIVNRKWYELTALRRAADILIKFCKLSWAHTACLPCVAPCDSHALFYVSYFQTIFELCQQITSCSTRRIIIMENRLDLTRQTVWKQWYNSTV